MFLLLSGCCCCRLVLKKTQLSLHPFAEDTAFEAGVRVQIHSQAEPPFVHELGFGVAPGFQTFVATQEQRVGGPSSLYDDFTRCVVV